MPNPSVVLATAGYDHTVRFWEATRGVCYRTLQYADSQVNKLEITPDKRYLAAAGNPHIRLFEVNTQNLQPVTSYDGHQGNVTAVGFERDGRWMYSGSDDGTVKIWDLRAGGYQREYESRGAVTCCVLHPNGTELISGDQNGNVRVWDLTQNACSCELVPEVGVAVRSVSIAGDGSLVVAANSSGTCYVWKLQRGTKTTAHFEPLHKLQAHNAYVLKCLLSPDCRLLATTSSDKTVKLWNLDGFKLERTLEGHQRWVWDCVFSVDAAYLVTASSDTSARLWDCASGEAIRIYSGHHKAAVCCALNDSAVDVTEAAHSGARRPFPMSPAGNASSFCFPRRPRSATSASSASGVDTPPQPPPSLAASSASSSCAAPRDEQKLEEDGVPLTCSDDDPDVFEVLRRAGIKLDDAPREVFAPDVLRRAGEDEVDPRVTRAVDALTARLFPEAEDGKEPSWWRPDQSFWICEPTKPKQSEEETEDTPAHKRVPFDDDDPADDWHKRVGAALRDLAALRDSHAREDDASDEAEAAFERMLGACKVVLAWYGGVLEEGFECVPTPPMGSHIIRRRSIGDNDELDAQHHTHMANLARKWVKGDPQPISPGLPTSLYLQDQCSYLYDRVRTADHFFDGERQRIRASVKVAIDPRVTTLGATNVVVDLSKPPPPMPPPRPRVGIDVKSFYDDPTDPDWCRDGVCFVELGAASGHPDFMRRLRGVDGDKGYNPTVQESGIVTEIYEFTPPGVLVGDFLRGPHDCQAVPHGRCVVTCAATGLAATLDFGRGEAEYVRVGAVSGSIKNTRDGSNVAMLLGNLRGIGVHVSRVDSPDDATEDAITELVPADETRVGEIPRGFHGLYTPGAYANRRLWHVCADAARRAVAWDIEHEGLVDQKIHAFAIFQMEKHWGELEEDGRALFLPSGIKGREMRYEFTCVVTDSPGEDQVPPLPRFWEDRKAPPLVDPEPDGNFVPV